MKVIPYATQSIDKSDSKAIEEALYSEYLTQGPMVELFEKAVAEYCGAKYAVAVNSGTSALHIACLAAGLKKGDEGITSPITFVASANAILYCGAIPRFADVLSDTVCIDPKEIEKQINNRTKVIIPVHFAGHPCDMEEICKIAKKNKIIVIEDAAHALGAEYKGEKIGSCKYSDMTTLSFHAVKHITTGEGGMVLTNNRRLYELLKKFRSHGITRDPKMYNSDRGAWYYEMSELGYNYRLTDLQCALGISQLKKLPAFLKKRRNTAKKYDNYFYKTGYGLPLTVRSHVENAYHLYVVRFDRNKFQASRKEIFDEYRKAGIMVNVHYIPVYYQLYYKKLGYKKGICPRAEKYYDETITLPLYPGMSSRDVSRVINVTSKIMEKHER